MSEIRRAVALGFFDGVHRGHAALLERVKERAAELDAAPAVLTFDVHPDTLVFGKEVPLINSAPEREAGNSESPPSWWDMIFLSAIADREPRNACRPGAPNGASAVT